MTTNSFTPLARSYPDSLLAQVENDNRGLLASSQLWREGAPARIKQAIDACMAERKRRDQLAGEIYDAISEDADELPQTHFLFLLRSMLDELRMIRRELAAANRSRR